MPNGRFVLQGVTASDHVGAVSNVLAVPSPKVVLISAAFATERGMRLLEASLKPVASKTKLLCGIRNGVTTAQALSFSLKLGIETFAVDTGSLTTIFHPKVYYAQGKEEARALIGSANLTSGGLKRNIEAGLSLLLALSDKHDAALSADIAAKLLGMIEGYPKHVIPIKSADDVKKLLASGRVLDEALIVSPTSVAGSKNPALDDIPKMKLKTSAPVATAPTPAVAPFVLASGQRVLVWRSNELTRRDLTIPTREGTNPTGSMLLKKGAYDGIDQRHYFRDEVFDKLDWQADPGPWKKHLERAIAQFRVIIKGIDYGSFALRLSHNMSTTSAAYLQKNSMTQLHWGEARELVAKEDLLGRVLSLFADKKVADHFTLEID